MTTTAGTPDRPLRRDAERNRLRVLEAARRVFGEQGFSASLDDVAAEAGVGVGTVYRRFPDKECLVGALFAHGFTDLERAVDDALAAVDPWEGFAALARRSVELQVADRGLCEAFLGTDVLPDGLVDARDRVVERLREVVRRAARSGALRDGVVPEDLPLVLVMTVEVAHRTEQVAPGTWRRCLQVLLDGLRAGAGAPLDQPPLSADQLERVTGPWHRQH